MQLVNSGAVLAHARCGIALPSVLRLAGAIAGVLELLFAPPGLLDAVTDADVTFPPAVLWTFRISSIGLHAVIWTTIALVFGALAQRQMDQSPRLVRAEA